MKHQAGRLSELVSTFRLGDDAAPARVAAPPPAAHEVAARRVIQTAATRPAPRATPATPAPAVAIPPSSQPLADSDWESF
jgi:hypothetical protein